MRMLELVGLVVWSVLVTPVEPESETNRWAVDLSLAQELWPGPALEEAEDLFRVQLSWEGTELGLRPTHLFETFRVIPYSDLDPAIDASGRVHVRGDAELARFLAPGEVGLAVRTHRPEYRRFDFEGPALIDELGLRDGHVALLVGVVRDGQPGVVSVNSPQNYESGRFGGREYPMIWLKVESQVVAQDANVVLNNIGSWAAVFGAVLSFPVSYRGADPLAAHDGGALWEHATNAVRAIAGDESALAWFKERKQKLYCGELALLALNVGAQIPLNRASLEPEVGSATWLAFESVVERHENGQMSPIRRLNRNANIRWVDVDLAPPGWTATSTSPSRLSLQPMRLGQMIEASFRRLIPRASFGEVAADAQASWLDEVAERLLIMIGPALDRERRLSLQPSVAELVGALAQEWSSEQELRDALAPRIQEIEGGLCPDDPEACLFAPPLLFHLASRGDWPSGALGIRYIGHGLDFSLVREVQPTPP